MTKTSIERYCDECRYSGSWHYSDDGARSWRCPNYEAADMAKHAQRLSELANEAGTKRAREIVADAARVYYEFSANNIRDEIDAAGLPGSLIGPAFTWAASAKASEDGPLIKPTEPLRQVMATVGTTRHRIDVWRSCVWRGNREQESA